MLHLLVHPPSPAQREPTSTSTEVFIPYLASCTTFDCASRTLLGKRGCSRALYMRKKERHIVAEVYARVSCRIVGYRHCLASTSSLTDLVSNLTIAIHIVSVSPILADLDIEASIPASEQVLLFCQYNDLMEKISNAFDSYKISPYSLPYQSTFIPHQIDLRALVHSRSYSTTSSTLPLT